nr:unnamed protein product [Spirometra erinaceieuropaei]
MTHILRRRTEHFPDVFNRPSTISDASITRLPQVETNVEFDLSPSLHKTMRAVQQLSGGERPDRTRSLLRSADGKVETDDQVKASLLSDFFQSVFTREPSSIYAHPSIRQPTSPPIILPPPVPSLPSLNEEPLFSSTVVRAELLRMKPAKSSAPDRIPALALREQEAQIVEKILRH